MKIHKSIAAISFSFLIFLSPIVIVQAAGEKTSFEDCKKINFDTLGDIFKGANCTIVTGIIPFLFTLAVAAFIWGIIQYFLNAENEEKRKKGKSFMLWGLIALFVMISMWGLVSVFTDTLHLKTLIPQLSQ